MTSESESIPTKKIKIREIIKKKFLSNTKKTKVINKKKPPTYDFWSFKNKNFLWELLSTFSTNILYLIKNL